MRTILILALCLLCGSMVLGKPVRSIPKAPEAKKATVPDLAGDTNWGTLTQDGKAFTINGNAMWRAVGHIREDGKVFVLWTDLTNDEPCPGVYELRDGELHGTWARSSNSDFEKDGSGMRDIIRKVKPVEPDFK